MIPVNPDISIHEDEVRLDFIYAAGPGGQNVNKVATAVQLKFDASRSPSLPEPVRERLLKLAGRRINRDGVLLITARRYRTQERNRQDAMQRLIGLIRRAAAAPKPRKKTSPTPASRQRRLDAKRRQSMNKQLRAKVQLPDEGKP